MSFLEDILNIANTTNTSLKRSLVSGAIELAANALTKNPTKKAAAAVLNTTIFDWT